ncbi:hypothetical protein QVD17_07056 [Tagetes erecta]|uniref:Uncharacterized protein n=1 Tax=Tagetes erecta TaxID=13708 RepID=A0AAD8PCC4_TARER|nr:hypothetical protein QVD17_07056 [Tagetes erecta]
MRFSLIQAVSSVSRVKFDTVHPGEDTIQPCEEVKNTVQPGEVEQITVQPGEVEEITVQPGEKGRKTLFSRVKDCSAV